MKHVGVVGATDGIGLAIARQYLERGWRVGIVGRDPSKQAATLSELRDSVPDGFAVGVQCDVTETGRIRPAFEELIGELGQMDVFVYAAGVMPSAEDLSGRMSAVDPIVDVNLRGAIYFLELAADYMEDAGRGRLAAIGSVAGVRGRKGHPIYGASKAALHQYLEGLRHRLHGSGVGVTTIKPGWVRTRMLDEGVAGSRMAVDATTAAKLIIDGLERGRDSFFVPWWWSIVAAVLRALPVSLFKRLAPS